MRTAAAAALGDTLVRRLFLDLPDDTASGFFDGIDREGSLVAIALCRVAIDQYNRVQPLIV